MIYLLVGQDNSAKEKKIAQIKAEFFPSPQALSFDYQVLYGHRLDNDNLIQALNALPAVSSSRVVLIYQADELSAAQKKLIMDLHAQASKKLTVILDAEHLDEKDMLFKKFGRLITTCLMGPKMRHNVFDLMRAVSLNHKTEALDLLDELLKNGDYPLQIIGGMFWKWKNDKKHIPAPKFRRGLLAFQQADFNIKRSQLRPEHALEVLVVKLCA